MLDANKGKARLAIATLVLLILAAVPMSAWERSRATIFAVLPEGSSGPEGLTIGPDGNVYVATFGFTASGSASGPGQLFVFTPSGRLLRQVGVANSSPHLLGLAFHPTTGALLVIDFGGHQVLTVDPTTGDSQLFFAVNDAAGLNALTFDATGNVYVSDSSQGIIWKSGPNGGAATAWVTSALLTTAGVPPFGANGVQFSSDGTALYVANTGNDTIVKIPVANGTPGTPVVFVNSINGADGLIIDVQGNLWVAANQEDEIVVVDPGGKVIAKLGDFDGVDRQGVPRGLLFPASLAFSADGQFLYVTNLALNLKIFQLPPAIDTAWTQQVQRYTVSKIPARIPPLFGARD